MINIWSSTTGSYRPEVNRAQMNLLDSHDVPRALHSLDGDLNAMKLALLLLFLHPGLRLYYGTETGLAKMQAFQRARTSLSREAFPWDQPWNVDLRSYLKELADLRRTYPDLRQGNLRGGKPLEPMGWSDLTLLTINRGRIHPLELSVPNQCRNSMEL